MQTIAEIKQQYPQYADMSDEQLAKALHEKYYSDMPYGEFARKVGLKPKIPTKAQKEAVSPLNRFVRGALDPISGAAQMVYNAVPESVQNTGTEVDRWLFEKTGGLLGADRPFNQLLADEERAYQEARRATGQEGVDAYRLGGNILGDAILMAIGPKFKAPTFPGLVGEGAAYGGFFGATQPVYDPNANFWERKWDQIKTGAIAGAAASPVTAFAGRLINPKAASDPQIQTLMREGITPTPGQIMGGAARTTEEKLRSLPIMGDLITFGQRRSIAELNRAAYNRALNPIDKSAKGFPVGREGVAKVKQELTKAYDEILPKLTFQADDTFSQELSKINSMVSALPEAAQRRFTRDLQEKVIGKMTPTGRMSGESFKQVERELNSLVKKYRNDQSVDIKDVGAALNEVLFSMRRALSRANPEHAKRLQDINAGYANYAIIRDAGARQGAEQGFSAGQLAQAVRAMDKSIGKGNTATGQALMQDLSDAGKLLAQNFPNSGTADRALLAAGAVGSGAISPAIPASLVAGGLPYTPGIRNVIANLMARRPQWAGLLATPVRRSAPVVAPPLAIQEVVPPLAVQE